jgi:hypothetical protein
MPILGKLVLIGLLVASVPYPAMAATATKPVAAAATTTATGTPATGVVCQIAKSGAFVKVQAMNNGTSAVPAGDTFTFSMAGKTKSTTKTVTFKSDLAPGKARDVTTAIKAGNVVSCSPSS